MRQATEIVQAKAAEDIEMKTAKLFQRLDNSYKYFFEELSMTLLAATGDSEGNKTPEEFLAMGTTWDDLSVDWIETKVKYGRGDNFYRGITGASSLKDNKIPLAISNKRLKKLGDLDKRRLPRSGVIGQNFTTFLAERSVKKYFGDLTIEYKGSVQGGGTSVQADTVNNVLTTLTALRKGKEIAFPLRGMKVTTSISAFTKMKNIRGGEYNLVDFLIKQATSESEKKQWAKINSPYGWGRSKRPMRAVISPFIRYYFEVEFPRIVKQVFPGAIFKEDKK